MNQLAIDFDRPAARRSDPETSQMAAVIAIGRCEENRQKALKALLEAGERGLNDYELAGVTGEAQTNIGKRRGDLVTAGLVTNRMVLGPAGTPARDKRPSTTTGAPSLVWIHIDHVRPVHDG